MYTARVGKGGSDVAMNVALYQLTLYIVFSSEEWENHYLYVASSPNMVVPV